MAKFFRRWNTVWENLSSASQNAKKHNADGILLTTWGDCGNHQPWSTLYPPLFLGAQLLWNGLNVDDDKIGSCYRPGGFQKAFNMRIREIFYRIS